MTAATTTRNTVRLTIAGRDVTFGLGRESSSGWLVEHDGRPLGLVYRVESGPAESKWRARPRGRGPAAVAGHPTRAAAVAALYEATAR